jgi:hypothetical protein
MRLQLSGVMLVLMGVSAASAQVASHAPSHLTAGMGMKPSMAPAMEVMDKTVARVNSASLTDRDLLREMYLIFPYARQHNGFPKDMEPEIRRGALEMIIFEELVYQEATRLRLSIPPSRLAQAEKQFRDQFPSEDVYQQFLRIEAKGSPHLMREKIRRSLLIEQVLKADVSAKAMVSTAEARAYYDKNPQRFEHGESFSIQTISMIPPQNPSVDIQTEVRKRAEDALRQAKVTKSYREFGLLAEKLSDDDWHVNMGDRKEMPAGQLPPPLVAAALKMKVGEVSDLIQLGTNYTIFRLNSHTPAGKADFTAVKPQIQTDLEKVKFNTLRTELHKRLRANAKVEVL